MKKLDFNIYRGDPKTLVITLKGDYSAKTFLFGAKVDRQQTSDRIIEVTPTASYNSETDITTISIQLAETDTADRTENYLEYDLINLTDNKTECTGRLYLEGDVITPYDGFALPEDAVRFLQLDASSGADYDLVQVRVIDGEKKLVFITLSELKNQLNSI